MQRKGVPLLCKFPEVRLGTVREAVRGASPVWQQPFGRLLEPERRTTSARPSLGEESVRNAGGGAAAPVGGGGEGKAKKSLAYLNRSVEVAGRVLGRSGEGATAWLGGHGLVGGPRSWWVGGGGPQPGQRPTLPGFRHHLSDPLSDPPSTERQSSLE